MRPFVVRSTMLAAATLLMALAGTGERLAAEIGAQEPAPADAVRAWIDEVQIRTYPLGPGDPNPRFPELDGGPRIYPYPLQDRFLTEPAERAYRAVYLENRYLRVLCLPELGGRIHSVYDKVAGREMLYRNRVIRPGHLAVRGAWIAGGIEWNRGPEGHGVTSFSPVAVRITRNRDGSASMLIGTTEQVYGTGWEVTLTLHPDRKLLDEQVRLFNPTDGFHPYYFWNNVAFPRTDSTRFIFPMSLATDHAGESFFRWPIHDGRNLSWLRNYPEPTSVFGYRVEENFFGAYDAGTDYGIVQVADHHLLPGKKAWTWGRSEAGRVAQQLLTEEDGPYIEIQSGPLPTQADFDMLLPGQEISWKEVWYPVAGLGDGFEYANRHVAVQRRAVAGGIELAFAATEPITGARLEILRPDGRVLRWRPDLTPARAERVLVELPSGLDADTPLRVRLRRGSGDTLLEYTSPLEIPRREIPADAGGEERGPGSEPGAAEATTAGSLFAAGWSADLRGDRREAIARYEAALAVDPAHGEASRALAALELERGRPERVEEILLPALERRPAEGLSWYLLGVARLRQGRLEEAEDAGYRSLRQAGSTALGWGLVGRARARRGDHVGALDALTTALSAGGADWTRLFEQALIATYGAGRTETAVAMARQATASGTIRLLPHLLSGFADPEALAEAAADARRWLGEPDYAFLRAAHELDRMGLTRAAANVLEAGAVTGVPAGRRDPMALYTLAWLTSRAGDAEAAGTWMQQAATAARGAGSISPSLLDSLPVLAWALEARPEDGTLREALGNLYAGLGRIEEAVTAWRAAVDLDPSRSVARRNLGARALSRDDPEAAAAWFREAWEARPRDTTLARDLARALRQTGRLEEAISVLEGLGDPADRRRDIVVLLADAYVEAGRPEAALTLLETTTFAAREGNVAPWEVFHRAHVARGLTLLDAGDPAAALEHFSAALTYPANLGVGRPHRPREARAWYWRGRALEALGRHDEARESWETCVRQRGETDDELIGHCRRALGEPPGRDPAAPAR